MSNPSRTQQFARLYKVLKKVYKPVAPDANRSVLEHLLFASCLENAHYQPAEEAFAALVHNFFDWNEVRVSTVRELAEVMAGLPDPPAAATRVKRVLQSIFEATYSFDLEDLRKKNLGPAIEHLSRLDGTTKFTVAYVIQAALGGHAIAVDAGTLNVLRLLDFITDENVQSGTVPGLERAISKSKGIEFGSLLHQLGADFVANSYAPTLHATLLEIEPSVANRLPTRRARKPVPETPTPGDTGAGAAPSTPVPAESARAGGSAAPSAGKPKPSAEKKPKPVSRKKKPESGAPDPAAVAQPEPSSPAPPSSPAVASAGSSAPPETPQTPAAPSKPATPTPKKAAAKKKSAEGSDSGTAPDKPPDPAALSKRKPR